MEKGYLFLKIEPKISLKLTEVEKSSSGVILLTYTAKEAYRSLFGYVNNSRDISKLKVDFRISLFRFVAT